MKGAQGLLLALVIGGVVYMATRKDKRAQVLEYVKSHAAAADLTRVTQVVASMTSAEINTLYDYLYTYSGNEASLPPAVAQGMADIAKKYNIGS